MSISRSILSILALGAGCAVHAAEQFETSVPVDLVRYLSGGGVAYRDLPEGFPPFIMPEGILPIGSQDSGFRQLVLLRTSRGGAESQEAVAAALRAQSEGWVVLPPPGMTRQNGFIIPGPAISTQPQRLCHDNYGVLEILGEDGIENRVYITRTSMPQGSERPDCQSQGQMIAGRMRPEPPDMEFMQYLPTLPGELLMPASASGPPPTVRGDPAPRIVRDPPVTTLNAPALGIRGIPAGGVGFVAGSRIRRGMGDGNSVESEFELSANERSPEDVGDLIGEALRAAGWKRDSEWDSRNGAGGTWTRTPEPGMNLAFSYTVMKTGEDGYSLKVRLKKL